ncbi:MAG: ElyC/SanA/YdcF family protein [Pseudomonadota bacterium]
MLKKIIRRLMFPVGMVLLIWVAGAWLWIRRPQQKKGPLLLLLSGLLLLFLSLPVTSGGLLDILEKKAGNYADPAGLNRMKVKYIVVLGGDHRPWNRTPADQLGGDTIMRLMEGLRLHRNMPGSTLILSGGSFQYKTGVAQYMAALAKELGVAEKAILLETASWDTRDQAKALKPGLDHQPFALVTSAYHMPRSMMIFKHYGLKPFPAPADFLVRGKTGVTYNSFIPSASGLQASEIFVYECLGLLWYRMTAFFD